MCVEVNSIDVIVMYGKLYACDTVGFGTTII